MGDRLDLLLESRRADLARFIVNNRLVLGPADAMRYFHSTLTTLVTAAQREKDVATAAATQEAEDFDDTVRKAELAARKGGENQVKGDRRGGREGAWAGGCVAIVPCAVVLGHWDGGEVRCPAMLCL